MCLDTSLQNKADDLNAIALVEEKLSNYINEFKDKSVLEDAANYHFNTGGSRTRARLTFLFAKNLGLSTEDSLVISCAPELFHNASLIHDDLQDSDDLRRGQEAVWKMFNTKVAICVGDFLISAAYACIADLSSSISKSTLIKHVHIKISELIQGQLLDIRQSEDQTLDDIDIYENIAARKTGPLFSLALTLPLIAKGYTESVPLAETVFAHYSIAYQIFDDICDYEMDQSKLGINSGVNIITLFQEKKIPKPRLKAVHTALNHLDLARGRIHGLPKVCQKIIHYETILLENDIKKFSSNQD